MKVYTILLAALPFATTLRAEDVVDNLANANSSQMVLNASGEMAAQAFTTGPGFTTLDSVTVRLRHFIPPVPPFGSSTARIQLRSDENDLPGTALELVGTVTGFANDDEFTVNSTTNTLLQPETRYWIVVSYFSGDFDWRNTADSSITPASTGTLPEMRATSTDSGANWTPTAPGNFQKMKVVASPVPGITVTTSADDTTTPPDGSLRKAIADAAEGATITFDLPDGDRTIVLDGAELAIGKSLIIDASSLPGGVVLSGDRTGDGPSADDSRIFNITGTSIVVLDSLTITGGRTPDSAGDPRGGGIRHFSSGKVTLRNCTVTHNRARTDGGGIICGGPMTLSRCTVSHNRAGEDGGVGPGGGIRMDEAELTIQNSTVSHNRAGDRTDADDGNNGGGIAAAGTLNLVNSTVTANHAGKGDTARNGGDGGGISLNSGIYTVFLHNSIVAGNFVGEAGDGGSPGQGADFEQDFQTTLTGINLIGDNTLGTGSASTVFPAGPTVGTGAAPLDPLLGPLADNGGPTQTHLPLRGSPALNATGLTDPGDFPTDQRGDGFPRIVGGIMDIGAVEAPLYVAPVLRLTGPRTIRTTRPRVVIRGRTIDADNDVRLVRFRDSRPRGARFRNARGTTRWSANVVLRPRVNVVRVQAFDRSGLRSRILVVRVIRTVRRR